MGDNRLEELVSDWKRGRLWHADAPLPLKKTWKGLDDTTAWNRWTTYLAKRKAAPPFDKFPMGASDPLVWGVPITPETDAALAWRVKLAALLADPSDVSGSRLEELLEPVMNTPADAVDNLPHALQLLTVAYWLPQLAPQLTLNDWWQLTTHLIAVARESQVAGKPEGKAESFLVATLLAGELPLALSCILGELKPLRDLRSPARISLSESLCEATDGEGVVAAWLLPYLPTLFASWTRCRAMGRAMPKNCWTTEAETQYEWLVRQTLILSRHDGTPLLTSDAYRNWPGGPMDAALSLAGDHGDQAAAARRLGTVLLAPQQLRSKGPLPEASLESEWANLAVLARGWEPADQRFAIDYSTANPTIELESGGKTLLGGTWEIELSYGGKPLRVVSDWEQQCWFTNDECDYLELAVELSEGGRLERQILFGKEDEFLFLHDILHSERETPADWTHVHRLPLAGGFAYRPEAETRDGVLVNPKGRAIASVLPIALPEWRIDSRPGELGQQGDRLQLANYGHGVRASAPVWFDLRTKRVGKPRTWRVLTVAASLEVVPRDVAVGYRVQTGSAQWLIYRSLAAPANRTVLGQNTSSESLIGRFLKTGDIDVLVEVDPA